VQKPAIDHSGSQQNSLQSIRVSLDSSVEKEQIQHEKFSSISENSIPVYIDKNLNFTNSGIDDWKLNVINLEETNKSNNLENQPESQNKVFGLLSINHLKGDANNYEGYK